MRTLALERPGFRRARTPMPRSQNPASRPRTGPGSPPRSYSCTRPRVTTPNASHHAAATPPTRAPPRGAPGRPGPGERVVGEGDDLGDPPAGHAQDVDRQRQVRALPLPPE